MYWLCWLQNVLRTVVNYLWQKPLLLATMPLSETDIFENTIKPRFFQTFQSTENDWSQNISPVFYDQTLLESYMDDPENTLEKEWKQRIMMTHTPRGNVIMYYHAQKEGFVYFCDQASVSYKILNALAMKYTMMFRCRDLFLDEQVYEEIRLIETKSDITYCNGLLEKCKEEERKEKSKKQKTYSDIAQGKCEQQDVFVKKNVPSNRLHEMNTSKSEMVNNKFMYMGKLNNITFIPSHNKHHSTSSSKIYNYADFKSCLVF